LFAFWQFGSQEQEARSRVDAVAGDVTEPRLGLGEADYRTLARSCTHVIHSAGAVRMNLPLDEARRSAVGSAENIAALARASRASGQLRKVEFVSTVGVLGRRAGELQEDWETGRREFHNTYEAAKAEAEDYIRRQIDAGLPVTVHRPSMVVGDSRTGKIIRFQVFYHLCEFLSGRRTRGVYPDLGRYRLDTVPADYVGAAIAWYSRQQGRVGEIVHLCSGPARAIPLAELKAMLESMLRERGAQLPRPVKLSPAMFRIAARLVERVVDAKTRRALRTLPAFLDYLGSEQGFANRKTAATLQSAGIPSPAASDYLPKALAYYFRGV
jgi:thioester reductase-like protein